MKIFYFRIKHMPELPDVQAFKSYLDATSLHQKISKVEVKDAKMVKNSSGKRFASELKDHGFESSHRHGKNLFVELDNNKYLLLHFGLTGSLQYYKNEEEEPEHARVLFHFKNGYILAFIDVRKFGEVKYPLEMKDYINENLGPDALDLSWDDFQELFDKKRGNIKSSLMDQKFIAGIGNIYSDEILFQAKVHPDAKIEDLEKKQLKSIFQKMQYVLERAIDKKGDPDNLPRTWLINHREEGDKCPRCGGKILKKTIGGRSSYFCPECQENQ